METPAFYASITSSYMSRQGRTYQAIAEFFDICDGLDETLGYRFRDSRFTGNNSVVLSGPGMEWSTDKDGVDRQVEVHIGHDVLATVLIAAIEQRKVALDADQKARLLAALT
ncbi:MAG: hypothetical protein WA975_05015 [Mesorhizobium sp.]